METKYKTEQCGQEQVFVGFGSNIDKYNSIQLGIQKLLQYYSDLLISDVYESIPFGFDAENFYNLVVGFMTTDSVQTVAANLRQIEIDLGRTADEARFASRILDIDLLIYGDHIIKSDTIRVPREDILEYSFVLKPLSEIAADTVHPLAGKSFKQLWQEFRGNRDNLWKIDMDLSLVQTGQI